MSVDKFVANDILSNAAVVLKTTKTKTVGIRLKVYYVIALFKKPGVYGAYKKKSMWYTAYTPFITLPILSSFAYTNGIFS